MALQDIMRRVGGLRGLAAGAAIAWGTAQATTIAEQAQADAQAASDALRDTMERLSEYQAEVDRAHAERDEILDSMRKEARSYVVMDVQAGKYDATVATRAQELGWTPPPVMAVTADQAAAAGIPVGRTFSVVPGDPAEEIDV